MAGTCNAQACVSRVYKSVMEDVLSSVREAFVEDGVDEQVLAELQLIWQDRVDASKTIAPPAPAPTARNTGSLTSVAPPAQANQSATASDNRRSHVIANLHPAFVSLANNPNNSTVIIGGGAMGNNLNVTKPSAGEDGGLKGANGGPVIRTVDMGPGPSGRRNIVPIISASGSAFGATLPTVLSHSSNVGGGQQSVANSTVIIQQGPGGSGTVQLRPIQAAQLVGGTGGGHAGLVQGMGNNLITMNLPGNSTISLDQLRAGYGIVPGQPARKLIRLEPGGNLVDIKTVSGGQQLFRQLDGAAPILPDDPELLADLAMEPSELEIANNGGVVKVGVGTEKMQPPLPIAPIVSSFNDPHNPGQNMAVSTAGYARTEAVDAENSSAQSVARAGGDHEPPHDPISGALDMSNHRNGGVAAGKTMPGSEISVGIPHHKHAGRGDASRLMPDPVAPAHPVDSDLIANGAVASSSSSIPSLTSNPFVDLLHRGGAGGGRPISSLVNPMHSGTTVGELITHQPTGAAANHLQQLAAHHRGAATALGQTPHQSATALAAATAVAEAQHQQLLLHHQQSQQNVMQQQLLHQQNQQLLHQHYQQMQHQQHQQLLQLQHEMPNSIHHNNQININNQNQHGILPRATAPGTSSRPGPTRIVVNRPQARYEKRIPQLDGPSGISDDEDDDELDDSSFIKIEDSVQDPGSVASGSQRLDDSVRAPDSIMSSINPGTVSSSILDDDDGDDDDDVDDQPDEADAESVGEPLNSDDDISDEDPAELFDADNIVVCQYDKVTRARNRWKFVLKDGIMNIGGRDYIFSRATGEAEW